jgi:hypothetical protein
MRIIDASGSGLIETAPQGDIGLYYLPLSFADLDLSIEWKAFRTYGASEVIANAGILLRTPDPSGVDFSDEAQFEAFYGASIEVQIDETGKRISPATKESVYGDSLYKTGAIYGLAPAREWAACVASPDGGKASDLYWNRYDSTLRGPLISVKLNGRKISAADLTGMNKRTNGFVALQFHTGRVQFRNLSLS